MATGYKKWQTRSHYSCYESRQTDGEHRKGLSARYIREAVEASLRRLKTDYIDLYQSHDDDRDTPLAETMNAFDALIKEGKVRAIGASNYSAERLAKALEVSAELGLARYETIQPEYNLYDRQNFELELAPLVQKEHLGVINYYALASGFLSGNTAAPRMRIRVHVAMALWRNISIIGD